MAQSAVTVTPENPTPPTNLSCVGATPPLDSAQAAVDDGWVSGTSDTQANRNVFAAKTAAAGSGTSVDAEGKGAETSVTQTYSAAIYNPSGALVMVGVGPALPAPAVGFASMPQPNQNHASTLSPATNPTLSSIAPTTAVHGASGTDTITATGVGFTRQSVIMKDGVKVPTTFVSSTSLTAPVPKSAAAGTSSITVATGGVVTTAGQTLTYS